MRNSIRQLLAGAAMACAGLSAHATCGYDPVSGITVYDSTCVPGGARFAGGSIGGVSPINVGQVETLTYTLGAGSTGAISCSPSGYSVGGLSAATGTVSFTETLGGTDTCTLTATNNVITGASTQNTSITVIGPPGASLSAATANVTAGYGDALSYSVTNGTGVITCTLNGTHVLGIASGSGTSPYTASMTGTESCTLTVTSTSGATAQSTATFHVIAIPSAALSATYGTIYQHGGSNTLNYTLSNGTGSIYCVLNGASASGIAAGTGSVGYTPTNSSTEVCTLTVTNAAGTTATSATTFLVEPGATPISATWSTANAVGAASFAYSIPANYYTMTVKAWGAGGLNASPWGGSGGGGGGYAQATFAVSPGQVYYIVVGAKGSYVSSSTLCNFNGTDGNGPYEIDLANFAMSFPSHTGGQGVNGGAGGGGWSGVLSANVPYSPINTNNLTIYTASVVTNIASSYMVIAGGGGGGGWRTSGQGGGSAAVTGIGSALAGLPKTVGSPDWQGGVTPATTTNTCDATNGPPGLPSAYTLYAANGSGLDGSGIGGGGGGATGGAYGAPGWSSNSTEEGGGGYGGTNGINAAKGPSGSVSQKGAPSTPANSGDANHPANAGSVNHDGAVVLLLN
jgi:hypothetical protein